MRASIRNLLKKPIPLIIANSNRVRRESAYRHKKRINNVVPIIETWGHLSFYCAEELKDPLFADACFECWASNVGSLISAFSGLYRGSIFYIRDIMELSLSAFYLKSKGMSEIPEIPSWNSLRKVFSKIDCFQSYNLWCNKNKLGDENLAYLFKAYWKIAHRFEIHLGSEAAFWKDVSPFYSQSRLVLWNNFFIDINKDLLFMWFLFLHARKSLDLKDTYDHVFFFLDKFDRIMKKEHKSYLQAVNIRSKYKK